MEDFGSESDPETRMHPVRRVSFEAISSVPNAIRLRCESSCRLEGVVSALVQGIEIGSRTLARARAFEAGDILDVPVSYFPHVVLPNVVRFAIADTEISLPMAINSSEEVMAILGHANVRAENVAIDGGLLRGTIINPANGIYAPSAFIRVNGMVVRAVVVDPPRPRDGGGASSLFAVPIRMSDFSASGLHIELHVSGVDYPIALLKYASEAFELNDEKIIHLEEKIRQLQKSSAIQIESVANAIDRRLSIQQERIDAFIEYAISILMSAAPREWTDVTLTSLTDFLRKIGQLSNRVQDPVKQATVGPRTLTVPLDSDHLAFGWYDNETNESGSFRWMGQTALIGNPMAAHALDRIELTISQVYGAHEPMLSASIDDQPLSTSLTKHADGSFLVSLTAPPNANSMHGSSIQLESFATGCPAVDVGNNDQRVLSIAATKIEFHYKSASDNPNHG